MEIRPGYKQTEIGALPEEWSVKRLGDLGKVVRGGSPRPAGDPRYFNGNFIPWLTVGSLTNIPPDQLFVTSTATNLTEEGTKHSRTLPRGTLVIVNSGARTLGVAKVLSIACCANDGIAALLNQSAGEKRFICYFLNSQIKRLREVVAAGNDQLNLNTGRIAMIAVPFPDEVEQCRIANALSDVDALLDSLDRLIAKKRDLKQAAMQQLLTGKTRLPGFSGAWDSRPIGNFLRVRHGRSQHGIAVTSGMHPILASGGEIGRTNTYLYNKTSVLIGRKGTIDLPQFVELPFWAVDTLFYTEIYDAFPRFVFYKFLTIPWRNYNEASGVPSLNAKTIEKIVVQLPGIQEQESIASLLSDMDSELAALERRREKTRLLKLGMMQELLTGRVRLMVKAANVVPFPAENVPSTPAAKPHNWQINEAVVIAALVQRFGSEQFPLGRKRYTKLSYLLHRHVERTASGYLKKAAGPYNPATKYGGPEGIAQRNGYVRSHTSGKYSGFVAAEKIADAQAYFQKWYGDDALQWLEQFRFKKNDDLELLATVDMAMEDLRGGGTTPTLNAVKQVIHDHPEWEAKLNRPVFSDANIAAAMKTCNAILGGGTTESKST